MRKSILILCTGGTISMRRTPQGYSPASGYLQTSMEKIPEFKNSDMPHYTVHEYDTLIDSANMTPRHWAQIGETILKNYDNYDGFVVLHGTDTMAYTASALSFMLENLSKPVIFTGSQLPLFETRNDARENLINAMFIASDSKISEVCVYFNHKLFRGNRCKKMDANSFAAFDSPNFPALGRVGADVMIRHQLMRKADQDHLRLQLIKPFEIGALRIFPGISLDMLQQLLHTSLQALVLETYGLGNAPEDPKFLSIIHQATERGMIIVNCSQCPAGKLKMDEYAAGTSLLTVGVVSGGDMTTEATIAKLFYLFSKNLSLSEIKSQIIVDLRGELTT